MFSTQTTDIDDVVIVRCKGRLVNSEAAYRLRNAICENSQVRAIVLDFSELETIEGGGLGMLAFLQQWARSKGTSLKLLNPSLRVEQKLNPSSQNGERKFEIERGSNVLSLVGLPLREHWVASGLAA